MVMIRTLLKARFRQAEKKIPSQRPWHHSKKYSKAFVTVLGFLLIPVIAFAEIFTGRQFGLSLFYFLSIFMVTRSAGTYWGLAAALAGTEMWFWSDMQFQDFYESPWVFLANAAIRFYFFGAVVGIIRSLEKEKKFARRDFLTGLANRQAFFELADVELSRTRRYNRPLSFAYMDSDNFKKVNDSFGHHTGNRLLKVFAETLQNNIRNTDIAVRLGGDEFGLLMPEADYESARLAMARIMRVLDQAMKDNGWPATVSAGIVTCMSAPLSVEKMIQMADDQMYAAKKSGKNTVRHEIYKPASGAVTKIS